MSQTDAVNRAAKILHAKRYGLKNPDRKYPTPDAVLSVITPKYGFTKAWDKKRRVWVRVPPDRRHVKLYHHLVDRVMAVADSMVAKPQDVERRKKKRGKRYEPMYPWVSLDPVKWKKSFFVWEVPPKKDLELARRYLTVAGLNWSKRNRGEGWGVMIKSGGKRKLKVWLVRLKEGGETDG